MSTLPRFPLFKLPLLAIEDVLSNMEFGTLLYLSFSSKKVYRFLQSLKIKVKEYIISVSNAFTLVQFSFEKWYGMGEWNFRESENPAEENFEALAISVGGLELESFSNFNWFITYTNGELQQSVKIGIKYLTELFICPLPRLYIFPDGMKKPILTSLVGFDDYCEDIIISGKEIIENEELHIILDKYSFREDVTFALPLKDDFISDIREWRHPNRIFIINDAHWVTSEMLFDVKCSYMMFGDCKNLKAIDCRLFVERWMNSSNLIFHYLRLRWEDGIPDGLNYDYFGLKLKEFNPKLRCHAYIQCEDFARDFSMGRDFVRKDGLLATITITYNFFTFCVWHERFPNLEGKIVFPFFVE